MKKLPLMLLGATALLASCTEQETTTTSTMTQTQIDSAVNSIVALREAEMYASNDSLINVMAAYRADSILAVRAGKTPPTPPRNTSRNTSGNNNNNNTPGTPVTPANPKEDRLKNDAGVNDGKTVPTAEQTKSKKDRLNKDAGE